VTACWVGGEERDIHFLSTAMGQGAALALPVWALYMKKVYEDESLGYSQDETFTIKVPKYERIEDEDFDIIDDSQTPSEGEIIEDVDSYFD
jgi:penicillin-binding protein 1A